MHLVKQACGALAEAHAAGLIHRDIKPSNLMICQRGGVPDFLKVMDFGLVKSVVGRPEALAVTESASSHIVGTPLYLAPEAISGAPVDARSDIYALGAVLYFLVVGAPVFLGRTVVEVCTQHLLADPTPPSELTKQPVPADLEQIILRCLAKKPEQRFASVGALHLALSEVSGLTSWSEGEALSWWSRWQASRAPAA